jgi:hypothetical protein
MTCMHWYEMKLIKMVYYYAHDIKTLKSKKKNSTFESGINLEGKFYQKNWNCFSRQQIPNFHINILKPDKHQYQKAPQSFQFRYSKQKKTCKSEKKKNTLIKKKSCNNGWNAGFLLWMHSNSTNKVDLHFLCN